jgi:hypothetical protein
MREDRVVFQVTRRMLDRVLFAAIGLVLALAVVLPLQAQKVQERYDDKFKVAAEDGNVSIAASADGRYVFIAGKNGVMISDDYGKTGTWVQTVRLK